MHGPPPKIHPTSLSDYLGALAHAVLEPGLSWEVIDAKWPGIVEAFDGFDPEKVAAYTPPDIERLMRDPRIVRNRRKIEAIVYDAGELIVLDRENGSFREWLHGHGSYDDTVADLRRHFRFIGESNAYHFLYVVDENVPTHEEWMREHASATR